MTKTIIYDTDTGDILRRIGGPPSVITNQRLESNEAILTEPNESKIPDDAPSGVAAGVSIPDDLTGKKIDTSDGSIVDDPDYTPPRTREDIKNDLDNGTITTKEALMELLEL